MNPRFDSTMRQAFASAIHRFASDPHPASPGRMALAERCFDSYQRGVGAPRPKRK